MTFPAIASAQVSSPNGKVVWDELNNEGKISGFADNHKSWSIKTSKGRIPGKITCQPRGGFVIRIQSIVR